MHPSTAFVWHPFGWVTALNSLSCGLACSVGALCTRFRWIAVSVFLNALGRSSLSLHVLFFSQLCASLSSFSRNCSLINLHSYTVEIIIKHYWIAKVIQIHRYDQSWEILVFFNFLNNKNWFFCIFIKLIWLGVGFLNRTGAEIGY